MNRVVIDLKEKEVQKLIADFPWLLNLDYEIIPLLKNKGKEYRLSHGKRADLILKDRRSGRPVIVEFKAVPFYRENIGQILEYRARMASEFNDEESILKEIFQNKIFSPILILVVPSCTAEAKLACNLSGIEIYEYEGEITEFTKPEKRKTLEEFKKNIKLGDIPFNEDRKEVVEGIYEEIRDVLFELNLKDGWKNYKNPNGEYFYVLNMLFINKILFENREIVIGIYEDIFSDDVSENIILEYTSEDKELLIRFRELYIEKNFTPTNSAEIFEEYDNFYWSFELNKKAFLEDVKKNLKPIIKNYVDIIDNYFDN